MIPKRMALFLLLLLAVAPRSQAQSEPPPPATPPSSAAPTSSEMVVLRHCLAEYDRTATLGANQAGILKSCEVGLGDRVKAGQILGRVQDEDLVADLELKKAEASSDIEIRIDEKTKQWCEYKLKMLEGLRQKQFTSNEEYGLQKTVTENAALAVEESKHRRQLAQLRYRVAEAGVVMRQFVTPIDGMVVQVFKTEGESISWNDPVFRVVDPAVVRITGELDVSDAWRIRKGDRVRVSAEHNGAKLPIEGEEFQGEVAFVATELNIEHETCLIVALVKNRGELLRSGLWCRMAIEPGTGPKEPEGGKPLADGKTGEAEKPLRAHGVGSHFGVQSAAPGGPGNLMAASGGRPPGTTLDTSKEGSSPGRRSSMLPSMTGVPGTNRGGGLGSSGPGAGALPAGLGRSRSTRASGSR